MKVVRHNVRHYRLAWTPRTTDYVGARRGRLLCASYHGHWRNHVYWKCLCDCGTELICRFDSSSQKSCGCLNEDSIAKKDFRVMRPDGTWGLFKGKPVMLSTGQCFASISAMAKVVGIDRATMLRRMRSKPEAEWLEPGQPMGRGAAKHRMRLIEAARARHKAERAQPWSAANLVKANEKKKREKDAGSSGA